MTDGMIERVARALCVAGKTPPIYPQEVDAEWERFAYDARAVLTAMREPSKAMVVAAHAVEETAHKSYAELTKARFTAMIDAALEDGR
jgi:hypothetical protein